MRPSVLVFCVLLLTVPATAQDSRGWPRSFDDIGGTPSSAAGHRARDAVRDLVRGKLRISVEQLEALRRGDHPSGTSAPRPSARTAGFDAANVRVGGDTAPESEIHAAVNPTDPDNILVSAMRQDPSNPSEALLCPIWYTRDGGATWRKSAFRNLPRETGSFVVGGGDPVFAFDADGTAYFTWINLIISSGFRLRMNMYWATSTDGGETWTRAQDDMIGSAELTGPAGTEAFDKQWLAVDRTSSPHRGTVYAALFHPAPDGLKIAVRKKAPGDATFRKTSVRVSTPDMLFVQFSSIDIDPDGGVHVIFLGTTDSLVYSLYHARSTDGAETFPTPAKITDVRLPRFSPEQAAETVQGIDAQRMYPCPHIAIDRSAGPARGMLHVVWSGTGIDARQAHGTDVYYTRSADNGLTWSAPAVLNRDERGLVRDQFHPSIAVNGDGVVAVTWYDRRDDPANWKARYYLTQSFDGGASFPRDVPVASAAMDFQLAGGRNSGFGIGEYTQVVMTDAHVIPFWADGRTDDGDLDVYAAFIPVGAITSAGDPAPDRLGPLSGGLAIESAVPHPVTASSVVTWTQRRAGTVRVDVVDALGRVVAVLSDGMREAGRHTAVFNAAALPSGVYHCRVTTDTGRAALRLLRR